jgi:putative oxidoreductase
VKNYAVVPLRLALGIIFIYHGLQKAFGFFGGPGIEGFAGMLTHINIPYPQILAIIVASIELIGGIFLFLGTLVRLSATSILMVMLVALAKIHFANGFSIMKGGYEYILLIILTCIAVIISGPGSLSITRKNSLFYKL